MWFPFLRNCCPNRENTVLQIQYFAFLIGVSAIAMLTLHCAKVLGICNAPSTNGSYGYIHVSGASLERVPRVPGHPLRLDNACQAPVLRIIFYLEKLLI